MQATQERNALFHLFRLTTFICHIVWYVTLLHMHDRGHPRSHWRHEYPERGWIQFLILRLLYEKPAHGYSLMESVDRISSGFHRPESGSMYTLLRRMDQRGLLESDWELDPVSGPGRRVYKITPLGAEVLRVGLEAIARRKSLMDDLTQFYRRNFLKAVNGGEKSNE